MSFQTPGVYVREMESGPRPIAAAETSVPAILGLFPFVAPLDAIALDVEDAAGPRALRLLPGPVGADGTISRGAAAEAVVQLDEAAGRPPRSFAELKPLLEACGHKVQLQPAEGGVRVAGVGKDAPSVVLPAELVSATGTVKVEDPSRVEALWRSVHEVFPLDRPAPKHAAEWLAVHGIKVAGVRGSALFDDFVLPPVRVPHKAGFLRWLESFWARLSVADGSAAARHVGLPTDEDAAADVVFAALSADAATRGAFRAFLSEPTVFRFVAAVLGFFDNGGGAAWVSLWGVADVEGPITGDPVGRSGLHGFDDCEDVALHLAPGLSPRQQAEMLAFCERRRDRFAVLDGAPVCGPDVPIPASSSGHGALYAPWVTIARPTWCAAAPELEIPAALRRQALRVKAGEVAVPPSGHVAGLMARVDAARGVHKAPANELLLGVTGLTQAIGPAEQAVLNTRGVNVVRDLGDRGIRVWGARTLATASDPAWRYVNVRRLFLMIERSILVGSQWAVFEPNDRLLWTRLTRDVRAFLLRVWRSGALAGATPEEAFFVQCDAETNPPELIDAGQVNVRVGVAPTKPAEFVVFHIGQWDGGASLSE